MTSCMMYVKEGEVHRHTKKFEECKRRAAFSQTPHFFTSMQLRTPLRSRCIAKSWDQRRIALRQVQSSNARALRSNWVFSLWRGQLLRLADDPIIGHHSPQHIVDVLVLII